MNYTEEYNKLINEAVERDWTKKTAPCYVEVHHILPRCQGGSDDKSNLVVLSAQEHYHAHRLLAMAHPDTKGLQFAWWSMCNQKSGDRDYEVDAEEYASAKLVISKIASERLTGLTGSKSYRYGKTTSLRQRVAVSESNRNRTDVEKYNQRIAAMNRSDAAIKAVSDAAKNKTSKHIENLAKANKNRTAEATKAISDSVTAANKTEHVCPHCDKVGKGASMKRWHFDNCKHK